MRYILHACWLIFIIGLVQPLWGQTPHLPGWHSMTPLRMNQQQCFDKAVNALRTANLSNLKNQGRWNASATNGYLHAAISCVPSGDGVLVDVVVAGARGRGTEADRMRDALRDRMLGTLAAQFDPKAYYRLVAKHSGKVLDVNIPGGDQANVVQHQWHGGDNQRWWIEPVGEGYFRLVAKHSGKVLDVNLPGGDQANVVQNRWHGGDNQRWKIEALGDGTFRLTAKHSGKVLDVNIPGGDQANVVQHQWHGGNNQRWFIERVN